MTWRNDFVATRVWIFVAAPAPFETLRWRRVWRDCSRPRRRGFLFRTPQIQSQNWHSRRDNERHYRTLSFSELAALPVEELAAQTGCRLFVWTSGPFLPQALRLIETWRVSVLRAGFHLGEGVSELGRAHADSPRLISRPRLVSPSDIRPSSCCSAGAATPAQVERCARTDH